MAHHSEAFIGIDTSKLRNAVAIAEGGRTGKVRYLGEIDGTDAAMRVIFCPDRTASLRQRCKSSRAASSVFQLLERLALDTRHEAGNKPTR